MRKNLIVGIIGCGMAADYHINNLLSIAGVTLKWICDISRDVLEEKRQKYPSLVITTDYKDILQDPEVNAIVISTPPSSHLQITEACLKANKHTLIEKPLTSTYKQLASITRIIKKYPDIVVMDCSARHSRLQPKFQHFKDIIFSERLGFIYGIHHNAVNRASRPGIEYHPQAKWFQNKSIAGGGPLIDWGVYDLAFHLGILGINLKPSNVKTFAVKGLDSHSHQISSESIEEHAITLMEFDRDCVYYWERASNAYNETKNETRIYGTKGGLKFSYLSWETADYEYYYLDKSGKPRKEKLKVDMKRHTHHEDDFYAMDLHFVDCIKNKSKAVLPLSQSAEFLAIIFDSIENASFLKGFDINGNT